ncbi:MAG TPA: hypothetical protein VM925_12030 [Labilithrix sp.]|nr:hypothetical protein [Labilithrix sp.]
MFRRYHFLVLGFAVLSVSLVACGSDEDAPATTNGVNDVAKACAIRAQWTAATSPDCFDCLGASVVARCDCSTKDYAGRCSEQQNAKNAEATCAGVGECVFKCPTNDCACVDACYASKDACRPRGAALDGCLAEVCDPHCR